MDEIIRKALDAAGYIDMPATQEALYDCFLDYVNAGYWKNLNIQEVLDEIDAGMITIGDMINALAGKKTIA